MPMLETQKLGIGLCKTWMTDCLTIIKEYSSTPCVNSTTISNWRTTLYLGFKKFSLQLPSILWFRPILALKAL